MKHRQSIQHMVRVDLEYRERLGRERYGTSLYPYNGREAILDAYEEALDLCCYLRQVIEELMIDPTKPNPPPDVKDTTEQPHHRAARTLTDAETEWVKNTAEGPGA